MKYIFVDPIFWLSVLFLLYILNKIYFKNKFINSIYYLYILLLIIFSLPVVANYLVNLHEITTPSEHNDTCINHESKDMTIIVLSGGLNDIAGNSLLSKLQLTTYGRALSAFEIYKNSKSKIDKIIIAGGVGHKYKEADIIKELFIELGIEGDKLIVDNKSINTYQNAVNIALLLDAHSHNTEHSDLILITSALHMKRALYAFNRAGLNPCAYPVYSIYVEDSHWIPRLSGLRKSTEVIQEIFSYWLYLVIH